MKIIVLIIITLFVCIVLSQRIKFGNIYNSDLSIRINSQTVNNIQFTLSYTTPQFYTASAATDLIATEAQKVFKPKPLLFLVDTTNLAGADAAAKATTLNTFPNFTSIKLTNILNTPSSNPSGVTTSPASLQTGLAGDVLATDVKNLISAATVLTSGSVTVTGNSTLTSQPVTCTIAPSADIVTTPLVIGRTYALGISIMNEVILPTTSVSGVWQGIQSDGQSVGITTMYSPLVWAGFTITDDMIYYNIINVISITYGLL